MESNNGTMPQSHQELFGYYNNEVLDKRDSETEGMDGIYSATEERRKQTEKRTGRINQSPTMTADPS